MSPTADDGPEYTTVGVGAPDMERFDAITIDGGDVLVYDRDNEAAWIQTDTAVDLDRMA
jgi:hypothetical protein